MSDETTRARLGEETLRYLRRHSDNPWVRGLLELLDERDAAHAETVARLERALAEAAMDRDYWKARAQAFAPAPDGDVTP